MFKPFKNNKKKVKLTTLAFTLIELLTVIVILVVILAIAIPTITTLINNIKKNAFESDARIVLRAINNTVDTTDDLELININETNIYELFNIEPDNYQSIEVRYILGQATIIIIGKNKWENLAACGNNQEMFVGTKEECDNMYAQTIMVWNTENISEGSSEINQIRLPLVSNGTYDFIVDWGDGNQSHITEYDQAIYAYDESGIYTIKTNGELEGWRFANMGDRLKLFEIKQWGNIRLGNNEGYFHGASNMIITAEDILNLTGTTTLSNAFRDCSSITTVPSINDWDVSNVQSLWRTFWGASNFNNPINSWNVSKVTNMSQMFRSASHFNQPIGNWDTSNVINMTWMFADTPFNQDISNWDTSKVTNMSYMFWRSDFNQPIGNWDTSKVTNMSYMFTWTDFNQPIGNWDILNVTTMRNMFYYNSEFNQPINNWDVRNVVDMRSMFAGASSFNQPLDNWDVSKVKIMGGDAVHEGMFRIATSFNQDISSWNVSNVEEFDNFFSGTQLTTPNYDALLISWNNLPSLQTDIIFHGGNSKYSSEAISARQNIIDTYGWTIIDGGQLE